MSNGFALLRVQMKSSEDPRFRALNLYRSQTLSLSQHSFQCVNYWRIRHGTKPGQRSTIHSHKESFVLEKSLERELAVSL